MKIQAVLVSLLGLISYASAQTMPDPFVIIGDLFTLVQKPTGKYVAKPTK